MAVPPEELARKQYFSDDIFKWNPNEIIGGNMKKYIALLMVFFFLIGCTSSTIINTKPDGAEIYIDNIKVGKTPYTHSDTDLAGTVKPVKIIKEGYVPLETVIRKNEPDAGAIIGTILILFPVVWVLGYPEKYDFELQKL